MIAPAITYRLKSFINIAEGTFSDQPQEGNTILAALDNGSLVAIEYTGSKNPTTFEDFKAYIENKSQKTFKSSSIKLITAELEDSSAFEDQIDELRESLTSEGKSKDEIRAALKDFKTSKATLIAQAKVAIAPDTILRSAVAFPAKPQFIQVAGVQYKKLTSRAILFDAEGLPSTTGLYFVSNSANVVPVLVEEAKNKDGEMLGFKTSRLSNLASKYHFDFLTDHILRTVRKQLKENKEAHLSRLAKDYGTISECQNQEFKDILNRLEAATKIKGAQKVDACVAWAADFKKLKEMVSNDMSLVKFVNMSIGVFLNDFKPEEKAVRSVYGKNTANINLSKFSPDIKAAAAQEMQQSLETEPFITTYFFPAPLAYPELSESWGFMANNLNSDNIPCPTIMSVFKIKPIVEKFNKSGAKDA